MHILQALQFDSFITLGTDIVNEGLDVVGQLSESTVGVLFKEIILDFRKNKLTFFFFLDRLSVALPLLFLCSKKSFLAIFDIDFIVIDAEELMEHSFIGPGCHQGSNNVFLPLSDE